jgi:hypothetical protein
VSLKFREEVEIVDINWGRREWLTWNVSLRSRKEEGPLDFIR